MSHLQSTSKVKANALWSKSKEDLLKQLGELKTDLGQLRIQKINSSGAKLNRMYVPQKDNPTDPDPAMFLGIAR